MIFRHLFRLAAIIMMGISMVACTSKISSLDARPDNAYPHYTLQQDARIEYYRFGHGTQIVMIEGYGTDITGWSRRFLARLASRHEVIVFNHRHVGGSYALASPYNYNELADDTYQLMRQLRLHHPAVFGISMGGMVAQHVAIRYPGYISKLVLANTAIAGSKSVSPDIDTIEKMQHMPQTKWGRFYLAERLFFTTHDRIAMGWALATDRFLPNEYTEIDSRRVLGHQWLYINQWRQDDVSAIKISLLHMPVLIVNGGEDQVIPPTNSDILVKAIPGARMLRWPHGGHAIIYQYPVELADMIDDFISHSA